MELRQLRYFVAVAEEGNISRAAKRIYLTQPALSRQVQALEQEVGEALLERQAHSIRLTPVGDALLTEARELLRHADDVLNRVRAAGRTVRLRVGYAPSLATGILSAAIARFTRKHPDARVELSDLSTTEMLAGLVDEKLDVALCAGGRQPTRGLKWTPLVRVPLQLAVPRDHRLAGRSRVRLADLGSESLLVYSQREYPEYRDAITRWARVRRQRLRIAGEYGGAEDLMAAVESGLGVAIVTAQMARLFPNRVRLVTLSPAPEPVRITAGWRADRAGDKALAAFVGDLRAVAAAPR